jgi:hypothetical protein
MKTIAFAPSQIVWLDIVRVIQVVMICVTIGLFITAIPINYEYRSTVCKADPCQAGQRISAGGEP